MSRADDLFSDHFYRGVIPSATQVRHGAVCGADNAIDTGYQSIIVDFAQTGKMAPLDHIPARRVSSRAASRADFSIAARTKARGDQRAPAALVGKTA